MVAAFEAECGRGLCGFLRRRSADSFYRDAGPAQAFHVNGSNEPGADDCGANGFHLQFVLFTVMKGRRAVNGEDANSKFQTPIARGTRFQ